MVRDGKTGGRVWERGRRSFNYMYHVIQNWLIFCFILMASRVKLQTRGCISFISYCKQCKVIGTILYFGKQAQTAFSGAQVIYIMI